MPRSSERAATGAFAANAGRHPDGEHSRSAARGPAEIHHASRGGSRRDQRRLLVSVLPEQAGAGLRDSLENRGARLGGGPTDSRPSPVARASEASTRRAPLLFG